MPPSDLEEIKEMLNEFLIEQGHLKESITEIKEINQASLANIRGLSLANDHEFKVLKSQLDDLKNQLDEMASHIDPHITYLRLRHDSI